MKDQEYSNLEIARKQFAENMLAKREAQLKKMKELKDKGYSNFLIARELGIAESTVRDMLAFG
jgi:DNA-binding CsgD family transcriptional regulator